MTKVSKIIPPSPTYRYPLSKRLHIMAIARRLPPLPANDPPFDEFGIRTSALKGHTTDRINDASIPCTRRLLDQKRQYKHRFSEERLKALEALIERSQYTIYARLGSSFGSQSKDANAQTKNRPTIRKDAEIKKLMERILKISLPKRVFSPPPIDRGPPGNLEDLLPRLQELALLPEFKRFRRISQQEWYKNPSKVSPQALKYVITDHILKLAKPRPVHMF